MPLLDVLPLPDLLVPVGNFSAQIQAAIDSFVSAEDAEVGAQPGSESDPMHASDTAATMPGAPSKPRKRKVSIQCSIVSNIQVYR
eukprot:SAG31_NODE_1626_length_7710_cov_28.409933_8_plen_85_part_00